MLSPTDRKLLAALLSRQEETGAAAAELPPERIAEIAAGSTPSPDEAEALLASPLAREELVLQRRLQRLRRAAAPWEAGQEPMQSQGQEELVSYLSDPGLILGPAGEDDPFGPAPELAMQGHAAARLLMRGGPAAADIGPPAAVVEALEKNLPHELLKTVTVGNTAYYVFLQSGEEEGGLAVVREAPGSAPELVATDSFLVGPGGNELPKEVTDALKAIFGEPEADANEAGAAPAATADRAGQLLLAKAQELDGHLSSRDAAGTQHGNLACAWAVNQVAQRALGQPVGGGLSVLAMREVLGKQHTAVSEAGATGGTIIISCAPKTGQGHVGIVGEPVPGGRRVYSNSSSHALWMHNYTLHSWKAYFHGRKGLPVEFFDLNPPHARTGGASAYPGSLLREGSRGENVRTLQSRLAQLGFALAADGDFGPATREAVVAFQKKAKLSADGVVGPQTWAALWA